MRRIRHTLIALEVSYDIYCCPDGAEIDLGVNLKRTVIASMVFVLQQAAGEFAVWNILYKVLTEIYSGVVFVLGFSTYFFELAGFADSKAFDLGVGVTALGVCIALPVGYTY